MITKYDLVNAVDSHYETFKDFIDFEASMKLNTIPDPKDIKKVIDEINMDKDIPYYVTYPNDYTTEIKYVHEDKKENGHVSIDEIEKILNHYAGVLKSFEGNLRFCTYKETREKLSIGDKDVIEMMIDTLDEKYSYCIRIDKVIT